MALEKVRDLLCAAQKANTSVIAFDACDYNTIYACIKGAEAARRPVIVMLYPTMRSVFSFGAFAATVKDLAREASVPVGLHLDHCSDLSTIVEAIRDGFTSVMADGSAMPLEENIAFTKSVVDIAKIFDVDVEGEIGHVGKWRAALIIKMPTRLPSLTKRPFLPRERGWLPWRWRLEAVMGCTRPRRIWIWSGLWRLTRRWTCRWCCMVVPGFQRNSFIRHFAWESINLTWGRNFSY